MARLAHTPPDRYLRAGFFPQPRLVHLQAGGAPEWMRSLRALFLSDVHLRRGVSDGRLRALIDLIGRQRADLLLLGGDYAETPDQCARFFEALAHISHPLGGYAVPGNNDRAPRPALRRQMAAAGVALLNNECRRVPLPGGALEIAGCDDHKYGAPRTARLFSGAPAYRILLSHFPSPPDCACDLMLSGHTHAGQVNLLGLTPYSLGFERKYRLMAVRGCARAGGMQLLVGNGIGVSRIPLRLGAEPQIYLLEFVK